MSLSLSTSTSYKKPLCKVCRDAGKSEAEYQSHWVRSKSGKVVCPTLLSQRCRSCGKSGHTVKYCKTVMVVPTKLVTEKKEPKHKVQNKYAVLEEIDDNEEESSAVVVDGPKVTTTYLDMLVKEAPSVIVHLKDLKASVKNLLPIKLKHSWASETSSETTECDEPEFNDSDTDEEPSFARPKPTQMRTFSQSVIPLFE